MMQVSFLVWVGVQLQTMPVEKIQKPPSRPRPPLLRTPSVRGRNPETSRCRLATLRHVTATLRRRQFQTAEQLKAALRDPPPGPGFSPTRPRPPAPDIPPGPAARAWLGPAWSSRGV